MTPDPAGTDRARERWSRGMAMIAGRIDPAIARRWARALEGCPGPGRVEKALLEASATTGIDHHAVSLTRLWRQRPHLTGEALGLALVGSANLTGHALHHSIEVGVLVRDPVQVKRLVGHFRSLMSSEGPLERA